MARTVSIGKQDFGNLVENNYFYVDKTGFIKDWWENGDDVTLITRPRRFGKTLTMSMVDYFFSIQHAGCGYLFENLSIWEVEKYRKLQGAYPVIFLSFAGVKKDSYNRTCRKIGRLITEEYRKYAFLLESQKLLQAEKDEFLHVINNGLEEDDIEFSINQLAKYLYKHYGRRPIILLDEYDTPMQEAWLGGYWDEMADFMRELFNSAFKTNQYLERAIMTGITRVSKESVFSDLNNMEVVGVTSKKYQSVFGFTEEETFGSLEEFGLESEKADVKRWYDGFRFGECDNIYNPWSITKFLEHKELEPYWANTSSNKLVSSLIQRGSADVKKTAEDLLQGKSFEAEIDEEIVFNQLGQRKNSIWSLLLASGYLKIIKASLNPDGKFDCILTLTNKEIEIIFKDMFSGWFSDDNISYNAFLNALLEGRLKEMNVYMNDIAVYTFSYFDTGRKLSGIKAPERFYHGFVLGLIAELRGRYQITSNRESGFGRYDVMMVPLRKAEDCIILEFKVIEPESEKDLKDTAKSALKQIIDKRYAVALESAGIGHENIRIYGFAFRGQEVFIDGGYLNEYDPQGVRIQHDRRP